MNGTMMAAGLGAPKPSENIGRHDRYIGSGSDARKRLLRARFSVGERVAADHDGDQACRLCNRSGKQCLDGADARIERRSMSGEWEDQYAPRTR